MDLAQIGFAADTSGLDKAKSALQSLVPVATQAEQATDNVAAAMDAVSKSSTTTDAAVKKTTTTVRSLATGMGDQAKQSNVAKIANDNHANSHKGLSTQAMAAQHSIRSMVEQLAMGVPPTQVLSTQINHLAYAASGPGGLKAAFGEALSSLRGLVSGWALAGVGAVGIVAAFALIAKSAISAALATDNLRITTGLTLQQVKSYQQLGAIKGIGADEMNAGIQKFAEGVNDAQHGMGSLRDLMNANGKSAKTFGDYWTNTADLVAATANGAQKIKILQEAGLPTTAEWVRLFSQGGDAIKGILANTVQFDAIAQEKLIANARKFDDAWNTATTNFKNNLTSAIATAVAGMETLYEKASKTMREIGNSDFWNRFLPSDHKDIAKSMGIEPIGDRAGNPQRTRVMITGGTYLQKQADPKILPQLLHENQQAQARIAILGDLMSVEDQVKVKQLELNAAGLQGIGVSTQQRAALLNIVRAQGEMSRVQQQATAGIYDEAAARKAAADTLQSWIDKKLIDKTDTEQMAAAQQALANQLQQTSDAAQLAGAKFQSLKQIELEGTNFAKTLDTTVSGALNNLVSPIQDVTNGVTSLSDGFKNAGVVILKAIQEMIIKMLVLAPIARSLQGLFGGFGGLPLPGQGSFIGPVANAKGGVYNSASLSAYSGQVVDRPTLFKFASGAGLMGEAGPEGILPLKRGPNGSLGVQMYGANDNGAQNINYAPQNTYHVGGKVTSDDLSQLKRAQDDDRRNFTSRVAQANKQLNKRNYR